MGAQRRIKELNRSPDWELRPRALAPCCMGTNFPLMVPVTITTHKYLLPFPTSVGRSLRLCISTYLEEIEARPKGSEANRKFRWDMKGEISIYSRWHVYLNECNEKKQHLLDNLVSHSAVLMHTLMDYIYYLLVIIRKRGPQGLHSSEMEKQTCRLKPPGGNCRKHYIKSWLYLKSSGMKLTRNPQKKKKVKACLNQPDNYNSAL